MMNIHSKFVQLRSNTVQNGGYEDESCTRLHGSELKSNVRIPSVRVAIGWGRHTLWLLPILAVVVNDEPKNIFPLLVAESLCWLMMNPFFLLTRVIAPSCRVLLSIGIVAVFSALRMKWLDLATRSVIALIGLVLGSAAIAARRTMLTSSLIRQSAAVNRASGLATGRGQSEALDCWERFGQQECRSLLRQALNMIVEEDTLQTICRAVYILAFLHGEGKSEKTVKRLKGQIENQRKNRMEMLDLLAQLGELQQELSEAGYQNKYLSEQVRAANIRAADAEAKLAGYGLEAIPQRDEKEERKWAVYAHYQQSGSMNETAKQFSISKSTVKNYIDWCENQKMEEIA